MLELLAFCAACSVNAVLKKGDRPDCNRLAHADLLAEALTLDMKAWFTPDAGNYFSRISKAGIIQALQEAKGTPPAPAWHGMKKSELALLAARETAGTGWLPELLRPRETDCFGNQRSRVSRFARWPVTVAGHRVRRAITAVAVRTS